MNNLVKSDVSILMVEDNPRYLAELQEWLKDLGYQHFVTAENIEQTKELLNQHFDVIIADMRLGQQTDGGFEVLDEVQRRKITSIVLILTANDTTADCRRAFRAGAFDYISKNMKGNVFEEVDRSVQDAMRYINRWGNRHDEAWIQENKEDLLNKYRGKYIAVINNTVIESADTEEALKQQIQERKLPLFLPVIRKMEIESPHGVPVAELLKWKEREDNLVEFKSTLEWDVKTKTGNKKLKFEVLKTIAAFLNSESGTLLIGVQDDRSIFGLEKDFSLISEKDKQTRDGFEVKLRNLITSEIGVSFATSEYIKIRFEQFEDKTKTVCAVDVSKSPEPVFLKGERNKEFYIRKGNASQVLDVEQMYHHLRIRKWF